MTDSTEKTETLVIGDQELTLRPMNFKGLKSVWNHMKLVFGMQQKTVDPLDGVEAMIAVVVASARRTHDFVNVDWVEDNMTPGQIPTLFPIVLRVIENSGITLVADEPGKLDPAGTEPAPSPETSAG